MLSNCMDLNNKISKIRRFKLIVNFIKSILNNQYVPFIFINVEDIIFTKSELHILAQPEFENILLLMGVDEILENVIFLSDKTEKYRESITRQIISLTGLERCNLVMTSGYKNFVNSIIDVYIGSMKIRSCSKPWFVYIDTNLERVIDSFKMFQKLNSLNTTCFSLEKSTWYSYIFSDTYDIYDFKN